MTHLLTPASAAVALAVLIGNPSAAQSTSLWQQRADYTIEAALFPADHSYTGVERIAYVNNSPDTLTRLYFHLYPNAFRPGSMMDVRSRSIPDPDPRVGDRISTLAPGERGRLDIVSLAVDGADVAVTTEETIAFCDLASPILPGATANLTLDFEGRVPVQIRRSGRDNAEGIDYSMPQWYPKLSEYDDYGWHANPYVGREFYGVWGDFDVTLALPKAYTVAATGYRQEGEPAAAAWPRRVRKALKSGEYVAHRYTAPRVHDFTWAADTEYVREEFVTPDSTLLEFYYVPGEATTEAWRRLPPVMSAAMAYANEHYGAYPYDKYAFVQGGDGGMEYAMMTLITGEREFESLVGVSVHEMMHSWYQFVLATDEARFAWMDEGFTSYASAEIMNHLVAEGLLTGEVSANPHAGSALGYAEFAGAGMAEPLSTHSDHFTTNAAYGVGSYVKGELVLHQLRELIGARAFDRTMLRYFDTWKFRHPTPRDFIRVAEKESGQELDWYLEYMVNTTHQVDVAVDSVGSAADGTAVVYLSRASPMPFPTTVAVATVDGDTSRYLVPTVLQRGHAPLEGRVLAPDWPYTHPTYVLAVPLARERVASIAVNPDLVVSEASLENNTYPRPTPTEE